MTFRNYLVCLVSLFGLIDAFNLNKNTDDSSLFSYPIVNAAGTSITGQTNSFAHSFYSIPYAESPVGELRFMPPEPKVWTQKSFDASRPKVVKCPQMSSIKQGKVNEDCLVLNVHVPNSVSLGQLKSAKFEQLFPVMVFIHGGAYKVGTGTNKAFDGRFLSNSANTIVVTINYRLGALGFMVYKDDKVSFTGNQAIKDQRLALKWVHDEIRKFGGDPNKVTLFGVSAGAQSTTFHILSAESAPYFKRSIIQSNPGPFIYPSKQEARSTSEKFLKHLDCWSSYPSISSCLKNIPAQNIVLAASELSQEYLREGLLLDSIEPFNVHIDGVEFTDQPLKLVQTGQWQTDKDLIIGHNYDEHMKLDINIGKINKDTYLELTQMLVGPQFAESVINQYKKLVPLNAGSNFDYSDIYSLQAKDYYFKCPTRAFARFFSATTEKNVFMYIYNHSSCPELAGTNKLCTYSCHGCELVYEFGTAEFIGRDTNENDEIITEMFTDYWSSFAYNGKPESNQFTNWPRYTSNENGIIWPSLRIVAPQTSVDSSFYEDFCDFWDSTGIY